MTGPEVGAHHDRRYRIEPEPWSYSGRAAEVLRHEWVVRMVRGFSPRRLLDVGCGLGQLTSRLSGMDTELHAIDVSPAAVAHGQAAAPDWPGAHTRPVYACGSATALPYASERFDVIVASDGLYSWDLPVEARVRALRELHRVLHIGGRVLFTEHMRMARFDAFLGEIAESPLEIVAISYLYDRPWYQVESWFRAVQGVGIVRASRRARWIARVLMGVGRLFGRRGARHICVLALRPPP